MKGENPRNRKWKCRNVVLTLKKKKVRNDGFYPLEDCDLTRRIFLLSTKIKKMVRRSRLTILIPTTKKTKIVPTRIHLLMITTMSLMSMRK